jgi:hypothetical protein
MVALSMANYTKRQLVELLDALPEDSNIALVLLHDAVEGDIIIPLGQFDGDHPNADCFFVAIGDPDEVADQGRIEVLAEKPTPNFKQAFRGH